MKKFYAESEAKEKPLRGPIEPLKNVCSTEKLEEILKDGAELKVSYKVPECEAIKFVSDKTTGMEPPNESDQFTPKTGGLGLKRKINQEIQQISSFKKAKTLAEKRDQLQEEILKYGVAAIEKMYPRQAFYQQPIKKVTSPKIRGSPIKMKPKTLDFEEIDVRKILKPMSHGKYIREPDYDHMVFINRREGLVPLSSLCHEDTKSVLSNNVKLLKGRNVRLGKPRIFVKDSGRLVAVGGSRNSQSNGIQVIRAPKLVKILPMEKMLPFEMDKEYAEFVASAIPDLKMSKRVDIRTLKKLERMKKLEEENSEIKDDNVVNHLMEKFVNPPMEEETKDPKPEAIEEVTLKNETEMEIVSQEEVSEDFKVGPGQKVINEWSNEKTKGQMPIDISDDKPIVSESFKALMEHKKATNTISGVDVCDVPECYCHHEEDSNFIISKSTTPQTTSGSVTPKEPKAKEKTKTAKNLKKVKNALKNLGVNFHIFDEENEDPTKSGTVANCDKEYCKFGCICDSITGKFKIAPLHCGKVECMFHCSCGRDALRLTNHDQHRIGIAAEGLRSSKRMAQEELKFSNTVVASGVDLLMIGTGSGRQKRERKVPSRYQDTGAFFDSATGLPASNSQKAALLMLEENSQIVPASPNLVSVRRMTAENLKHEKIKKCTVIMPRLDFDFDKLKLWCMYHNVHDCPCFKYGNPLDYAPDFNKSRNVAKRTLGNKFKTKKNEEVILIPDESDDEVEVQPMMKKPEMCAKYPHEPGTHSARTFGHVIKNSLKKPTKYPQKVVIVPPMKVKKEGMEIKLDTKKATPEIQHFPIPDYPSPAEPGLMKRGPTKDYMIRDKYQKPPKGTPNIINPKPSTCQVDEFKDFKLTHKAKGSFMFVHWVIMRELIKSRQIKIWAHARRSQLVLLVGYVDDLCYVADAVDIHKDVAFVDKSNNMFDIMKNLPMEIPDSTHVALTHNGICWEVAGLCYNPPKEGKENGPNMDPNEKQKAYRKATKNPKIMYPCEKSGEITEAAPMSKLKKLNQVVVDLNARVEKLPPGVNLVTMERPGNSQPIQVKLPLTEANQNWCTIRVDTTESAVKCPESDLALKVHVLKKAADLAAKENTTVRIPIKTPDQESNFGVYAVPGLETHVFVGPFTSKSHVDTIVEEEDDDIVCLSDEQPQISSKPAPKQVEKCDYQAIKQEAIMGQIPQKLIRSETEEEMEIVENPQTIDDRNLHPTKRKVPYVNPEENPHGRTVFTPDEQRALFYQSGMDERLISVQVDENLTVKMFQGKDLVSFMHPKFADHEVICDDIEKAKLWYKFQKQEKPKKLMLKPMADLIDHTPRSISTDQEEVLEDSPIMNQALHPDRSINGRKFVCHRISHNGKHGVAIVFDRRQHQDMRKLYHKLNQILSSNGLRKVTDSIQILNRARDEIMRLERLEQNLTLKKKNLMLKRQQLFKEFTDKLKDLPRADKKQAVFELKEGLKKIKDHKVLASHSQSKWDETIMVPVDPESKLVPTINEIQYPQGELSSVVPRNSSSGITPYSDLTGLQTTRKDGKISRPMNAFMLWAKDQRKELISKGLDGVTVSRLLADKWKSMTSEEQAPFYLEAEKLKSAHQLQHPNYKYSPKARRLGMKKSVAKLDASPPQMEISQEEMETEPILPIVTLVEGNVGDLEHVQLEQPPCVELE